MSFFTQTARGGRSDRCNGFLSRRDACPVSTLGWPPSPISAADFHSSDSSLRQSHDLSEPISISCRRLHACWPATRSQPDCPAIGAGWPRLGCGSLVAQTSNVFPFHQKRAMFRHGRLGEILALGGELAIDHQFIGIVHNRRRRSLQRVCWADRIPFSTRWFPAGRFALARGDVPYPLGRQCKLRQRNASADAGTSCHWSVSCEIASTNCSADMRRTTGPRKTNLLSTASCIPTVGIWYARLVSIIAIVRLMSYP